MIKVKINHSGIHGTEKEVVIDNMYYDDSMDNIVIESTNHNLTIDDTLTFIEDDGDRRNFRERREITNILDENHFTVSSFPDRQLYPISATTAATTCYVGMSDDNTPIIKRMNYIKFSFSDGYQHEMIKSRSDITIVDNIDELYYYGKPDKYKRRCIGDYVLCDRMLYKSTGLTENYKLLISENPEDILNIKDKRIYFTGENGKRIILGGENLVNNALGESGNITVTKDLKEDGAYGVLITPFSYFCEDDNTELFWVYDSEDDDHNDIVKYLIDNFPYCDFYCKDERFFTEVYGWLNISNAVIDRDNDIVVDTEIRLTRDEIESGALEEMHPVDWYNEGELLKVEIVDATGVSYGCSEYYMCGCIGLVPNIKTTCDGEEVTSHIMRDYGFFDLVIPASDDYAVDMFRNELLNERFIEQEKKAAVNSIIDYERVQFAPMYLDENGFHQVTKITFKLHFRERPYEEVEGIERDYGDFETSDSYYWNTAKMEYYEDKDEIKFSIYYPQDSDYMNDIGFTDNDIYYQKKKIKNTFLRISCYDTRYRSTQSLLGYSTISLDSGRCYKRYIEYLKEPKNYDKPRVEFECVSKYSKEMSSDGFYIYAYPTIVDGAIPTNAYIKVEFNHAKYGKTIPLSFPTYYDTSDKGHILGDPIMPWDDSGFTKYFPVNYRKRENELGDYGMTGDTSNIVDIDMARAFKDTYIKIRLKYDIDTNQYIWYIVNEDGLTPKGIVNPENGEMTIIMWEPRLNGIMQEENNPDKIIEMGDIKTQNS